MTCLKIHHYALQDTFEVHLHKVKHFLPQCLGWESNESKEIYCMILTFRFLSFKSELQCYNSVVLKL